MIGRKRQESAAALKTPEQEAGDVMRSLARALNNPLKSAEKPAARQSQDLRHTLRAIEASFYLLDQLRDVIVEACHLVLRANVIEDLAGRALLAEQYDELRNAIERLIDGAEEEASALLGPSAEGITATLNATSSYTVFPTRLSLSSDSIDLPPPVEGFADTAEVARILGKLDKALDTLDQVSASYMKDAQYLMTKLGQ
ncbi:hypothetical protein [Aquisalinus flavus]|uniref:Uncharacterized protein n=1 Tax=Aquisalinus flavus TaxID=1526572 RepID=A0A8J2V0X5_9PROT|nr:hypothetical protein [Aquisalinus flavus]MBD0426841.1 hypothetical protein [Aquisalinus flavus]UNE46688.1 hypothetical protein FF099_00755 [Aquisalinus flavus]GGC96412.1 hypothetical protein GCM10011342_01540 [Aquisalinus flavus]